MTTNGTGEYLLLHAQIETEETEIPAPLDFEAMVDDMVSKIALGPHMTVEGISRLCAWFSTPGREVFARIECVNGKPVAYLVRGTSEDFLPAFLRKQALDMPDRRDTFERDQDARRERTDRERCADIYCQPDRLFR